MPALVWFRADLRTADNHALHHACAASNDGVVAVFTICPAQWDDHDWGPPRVEWTLRTLRELKTDLAALNIPLKIVTTDRFEGAPGALLKLASEMGADRLFYNIEYEVNELARDERVRAAFEGAGKSVHAFHDQTIIPVHDIRTKTGKHYTVYSPFRRAWEEIATDTDLWGPRPAPARQPALNIESDDVPDSVDGFEPATIDWDLWPAGERAATDRLASYIRERIARYAARRDYPSEDAVSAISPYLAVGSVSARTCAHAAAQSNQGRFNAGDKGVVKWIQELVWRDFYRHVLIGFPRVSRSRAFRPDVDADIPWSEDKGAFDAWREGRTGYPIVDAAMRQLRDTGWMHNRTRMVVAMFLTKHLLIDWRWGERHFMRTLLDADLANNNGGWQWSASTGTDAAPYFRIYNPTTQGEKFDESGEYVRRYVEELRELDSSDIHDPAPLDRARLGYPEPMVDHKQARERALAAYKREG